MNKLFKRTIAIFLIFALSLFSLTSCSFNEEDRDDFETLGEIDPELYKDATTFKYNIIKFGKQNGEDITWYVVDAGKNYRLLLSEKVLDFVQYNNDIDVNFEDSTLYNYLKNDFIKEHFSDEEANQLLMFTDDTKVTIPTLDDLRLYFGEVNVAKSEYYGDEEFFKANKEMVAKPSLSSDNDYLINNAFDNQLYAEKNQIELDKRYNFADGCQPYWIYDGNELYVNYVTSTGYVARVMQNNQFIGIRPIIKIKK